MRGAGQLMPACSALPPLLAQTAADMALLTSQGINSFKFFMAYKVGLELLLFV
jgi:hypothetical protein